MFEWLTNLFGNSEEAWRNAATRFANASRELEQAEQQHLSIRQMALDIGEEQSWNQLQDRILYTRQGIEEVAQSMRNTSQWFRSTFGMSGVQALPLVPIAIITASISAVVSLVYALSSYNENVRQKWAYINAQAGNITPAEAQAILESSPTGTGLGGAFQDATKLVTWIVIGGVVLMALPHVIGAKAEK